MCAYTNKPNVVNVFTESPFELQPTYDIVDGGVRFREEWLKKNFVSENAEVRDKIVGRFAIYKKLMRINDKRVAKHELQLERRRDLIAAMKIVEEKKQRRERKKEHFERKRRKELEKETNKAKWARDRRVKRILEKEAQQIKQDEQDLIIASKVPELPKKVRQKTAEATGGKSRKGGTDEKSGKNEKGRKDGKDVKGGKEEKGGKSKKGGKGEKGKKGGKIDKTKPDKKGKQDATIEHDREEQEMNQAILEEYEERVVAENQYDKDYWDNLSFLDWDVWSNLSSESLRSKDVYPLTYMTRLKFYRQEKAVEASVRENMPTPLVRKKQAEKILQLERQQVSCHWEERKHNARQRQRVMNEKACQWWKGEKRDWMTVPPGFNAIPLYKKYHKERFEKRRIMKVKECKDKKKALIENLLLESKKRQEGNINRFSMKKLESYLHDWYKPETFIRREGFEIYKMNMFKTKKTKTELNVRWLNPPTPEPELEPEPEVKETVPQPEKSRDRKKGKKQKGNESNKETTKGKTKEKGKKKEKEKEKKQKEKGKKKEKGKDKKKNEKEKKGKKEKGKEESITEEYDSPEPIAYLVEPINVPTLVDDLRMHEDSKRKPQERPNSHHDNCPTSDNRQDNRLTSSPSVILFDGFEADKIYTQKVTVINVRSPSQVWCRFDKVRYPQSCTNTTILQVDVATRKLLIPGFSFTFKMTFTPTNSTDDFEAEIIFIVQQTMLREERQYFHIPIKCTRRCEVSPDTIQILPTELRYPTVYKYNRKGNGVVLEERIMVVNRGLEEVTMKIEGSIKGLEYIPKEDSLNDKEEEKPPAGCPDNGYDREKWMKVMKFGRQFLAGNEISEAEVTRILSGPLDYLQDSTEDLGGACWNPQTSSYAPSIDDNYEDPFSGVVHLTADERFTVTLPPRSTTPVKMQFTPERPGQYTKIYHFTFIDPGLHDEQKGGSKEDKENEENKEYEAYEEWEESKECEEYIECKENKDNIKKKENILKLISLPVFAEILPMPLRLQSSPTIDLQVCIQDSGTYKGKIKVLNGDLRKAAPLIFVMPRCLEKYVTIKPKDALLQPNTSRTFSVIFNPSWKLIIDAPQYCTDDGFFRTVKFPIQIFSPTFKDFPKLSVKVMADVTSPNDLILSPRVLGLGIVSVEETVSAKLTLTNNSLAVTQYGFLNLPQFVSIQPGHGFGSIYPGDTQTLTLLYSPNAINETADNCKEHLLRDRKHIFKLNITTLASEGGKSLNIRKDMLEEKGYHNRNIEVLGDDEINMCTIESRVKEAAKQTTSNQVCLKYKLVNEDSEENWESENHKQFKRQNRARDGFEEIGSRSVMDLFYREENFPLTKTQDIFSMDNRLIKSEIKVHAYVMNPMCQLSKSKVVFAPTPYGGSSIFHLYLHAYKKWGKPCFCGFVPEEKEPFVARFSMSVPTDEILVSPVQGMIEKGQDQKVSLVFQPNVPMEKVIKLADEFRASTSKRASQPGTTAKEDFEEMSFDFPIFFEEPEENEEEIKSTESKKGKGEVTKQISEPEITQSQEFVEETPSERRRNLLRAEKCILQKMKPFEYQTTVRCAIRIFPTASPTATSIWQEYHQITLICPVCRPAFFLNLEDEDINFGLVPIGFRPRKYLTLQNISSTHIRVWTSTLDPVGPFYCQRPRNPRLDPEHMLGIPVTFTPLCEDHKEEYLSIRSGTTRKEVKVTGQGVQPTFKIQQEFLICRLEAGVGSRDDCRIEIQNNCAALLPFKIKLVYLKKGRDEPLPLPVEDSKTPTTKSNKADKISKKEKADKISKKEKADKISKKEKADTKLGKKSNKGKNENEKTTLKKTANELSPDEQYQFTHIMKKVKSFETSKIFTIINLNDIEIQCVKIPANENRAFIVRFSPPQRLAKPTDDRQTELKPKKNGKNDKKKGMNKTTKSKPKKVLGNTKESKKKSNLKSVISSKKQYPTKYAAKVVIYLGSYTVIKEFIFTGTVKADALKEEGKKNKGKEKGKAKGKGKR